MEMIPCHNEQIKPAEQVVKILPPFVREAATRSMALQCEVMFGSPSSNCDGNGICKIVARSEQPALPPVQRTRCDHARALFSAIDGGKGASLCFRREWLCSKLMKHHFRHGVLEMPEPCPIPQEIARALGLSIGELPAGLHLIEDYGTHFRINIRFNKIA